MRMVLAAMLLAGAFAGCTADPNSGAKPLLALAMAEVDAWRPDAVLQSVEGIEIANGTEMVRSGHVRGAGHIAAANHDDASPGNGKAPAWRFVFHADSGRSSFEVVLSPQEKVLYSAPSQASASYPVDAAAWRLDAEEAWRLAKAHDESLRNALSGGTWASFERLLAFPSFEHPIWILGAQTSADDNEGHFAVVNANNGTVYTMNDVLQELLNGAFSLREQGSEYGMVTATERQASHAFTIKDPYHKGLVVAVESQTAAPGQRLQIKLSGPGGNELLHFEHVTGAAILDGAGHATLSFPDAGEFTVTVTLDGLGTSGIGALYELSYCTDGVTMGMPFATRACGFVEPTQGPKPSPLLGSL